MRVKQEGAALLHPQYTNKFHLYVIQQSREAPRTVELAFKPRGHGENKPHAPQLPTESPGIIENTFVSVIMTTIITPNNFEKMPA